MEIRPVNEGDRAYLDLVYAIADQLSVDRSAHIGAIIVTPDREIISRGFNGFPAGVRLDLPERHERPEKYFYSGHAEATAVAAAAKNGRATNGCVMYTNGTPCDKCAIMIIGAGITEVIIDLDWDTKFSQLAGAEWEKSCAAAKTMFAECENPVKLIAISGYSTDWPRLLRGQYISY